MTSSGLPTEFSYLDCHFDPKESPAPARKLAMRDCTARILRIPRRASFSASAMSLAQKLANQLCAREVGPEPFRWIEMWGIARQQDHLDVMVHEERPNGLAAVCLQPIPDQVGGSAGQEFHQPATPSEDALQIVGVFDDLEGELRGRPIPAVEKATHHRSFGPTE